MALKLTLMALISLHDVTAHSSSFWKAWPEKKRWAGERPGIQMGLRAAPVSEWVLGEEGGRWTGRYLGDSAGVRAGP